MNAIAQHSDKEVKEDVVRHRAMAAAHEAAAKCLESGKKPDACGVLGQLSGKYPSAPPHLKSKADSERQRIGCP